MNPVFDFKISKFLTSFDFIEAGADVNTCIANTMGLTLLMKAVELRSLNLVHTLCSYKAKLNLRDKFGCTALMLAAAYDKSEIVRYLVGVGADPYVKVFQLRWLFSPYIFIVIGTKIKIFLSR